MFRLLHSCLLTRSGKCSYGSTRLVLRVLAVRYSRLSEPSEQLLDNSYHLSFSGKRRPPRTPLLYRAIRFNERFREFPDYLENFFARNPIIPFRPVELLTNPVECFTLFTTQFAERKDRQDFIFACTEVFAFHRFSPVRFVTGRWQSLPNKRPNWEYFGGCPLSGSVGGIKIRRAPGSSQQSCDFD
jgi:hypothetical protein